MSEFEVEENDLYVKIFTNDKYIKRVTNMINNCEKSLPVDFEDFLGTQFAEDLIDKPEEVIKEVLNKMLVSYLNANFELDDPVSYTVRIKSLIDTTSLREISSKHVGKLIQIRGIITHISKIEPMLVIGAFICSKCGGITLKPQTTDFIELPEQCDTKKEKRGVSWTLSQENSTLTDMQFIRVQECPEDLTAGSIPSFLNCRIKNRDLLNKVRAGDIVNIVGILNMNLPFNFNNKARTFDVRLDVNHIESVSRDYTSMVINADEEKQIKEMAQDPNIISRLTYSIVPSIYGYPYIKEAILYLLFGASTKDYGDIKVRGDIHILILGDPALAKSQLLMGVSKIAPRGIYASGKGASGVGLTAAIVKTQDGSKERIALEAGVLVLADRGIACIDELDKMDEKDRVAIHEALEQQTVSINKAGINATLPTRTAVLAAANPISGRYNRDITLMENIKFPPTLLSRFDLIFIVTDVPEEHADFDLAEHILNTHKEKMKKDIDPLFFKKYIAYAKRFNPTLTRETIDFIKKFYVDMRKKATEKVIPITARQLEAIQRLAEARARIQLKTQIDVDDAKRAVLVMCKSLESLGVDLEQPDIDRKELGIPSTKTEQMEEVYKIIRDFQRDHEVARVDEVIEEATKRLQISKDEVVGILKRLHDQGRTLQHSVSELTTAF